MTDNSTTNCLKCGNPLTPGVSSCPVCGTPVDQTAGVQAQTNVEVATTPVTNQTVQEVPTPVQDVPLVQPAVQPATNDGGIVAMAPTPTPVVPAQPAPVVQPVAPEPVVQPTNVESEKPKKKKVSFKLNNKTLVLILIIIVLFAGGAVLLKTKKGGTVGTVQNQQEQPIVLKIDAVANGFKFKIDDGWIVQSTSDVSIIKNAKDNVVIKLEKYQVNLSTLDKDELQENFDDLMSEYNPSPIKVSNVSIDDSPIASKKAFKVECTVLENDGKEYLAEYYFINGGSELTIGASVVYYNNEAKEAYSGIVNTLVGTISYANEADGIRDILSKTYQSFSIYYNALNGVNLDIPNDTPDEPTEGTDQNPENPNEGGEDVTGTDTPTEQEQPEIPVEA